MLRAIAKKFKQPSIIKLGRWDTKKILKKNNPKYDFCCLILGQKHCGNCIFDKKKTK